MRNPLESALGTVASEATSVARAAESAVASALGTLGQPMAANPQSPSNINSGKTDREMMIINKFSVEVEKIHLAYFRKVSDLAMTTDTDEVHEGGLNSHTHLLPKGTTIPKKIKLEKGVVVNDLLWAWYYEEVCNGIYEPRKVTINAHENIQSSTVASPVLVSWVLDTALPIGWSGLRFDADRSERLVHQITFMCVGWACIPGGAGLYKTTSPLSRSPASHESKGNLGDS